MVWSEDIRSAYWQHSSHVHAYVHLCTFCLHCADGLHVKKKNKKCVCFWSACARIKSCFACDRHTAPQETPFSVDNVTTSVCGTFPSSVKEKSVKQKSLTNPALSACFHNCVSLFCIPCTIGYWNATISGSSQHSQHHKVPSCLPDSSQPVDIKAKLVYHRPVSMHLASALTDGWHNLLALYL